MILYKQGSLVLLLISLCSPLSLTPYLVVWRERRGEEKTR
jgi:hypothetical protein